MANMAKEWILCILLFLSGWINSIVFEQVSQISYTNMSYPYPDSTSCSVQAKATDGIKNRSTCQCAQNTMGATDSNETLWWSAKLQVMKEIASVRIYFREDTLVGAALPPCEDKDVGCMGWSAIGLCRERPEYMAANCTKSCGLCTATIETSGCVDNDTNCTWMANNEECIRNPPYMLSMCRLSCNVCTPEFKTKYDRERSAAIKSLSVYIGNSSIASLFINSTVKQMANLQLLNTYTGPPTSLDSVIIRAPTDVTITGDMVYVVKDPSGILSLCEVEVMAKNETDGSLMCMTNTSQEVLVPVISAEISDPYPVSSCGGVDVTHDGNTTASGCGCAMSIPAESPSPDKYYWWKGNLHNGTIVRGIHIWARKEKDQCLDQDQACPGWAKIGLCRNESSTMFDKCPFSCGLCTTQYISDGYCTDSNSTCGDWKNHNECIQNPPIMMKYCRASCGWCPNGTEWRNYVATRLSVFQNTTVYVGYASGLGSLDLTTATSLGSFSEFGTPEALPLDDNPVVLRVALETPAYGDTIIMRRQQTTGTLSVCEVRVLGEYGQYLAQGQLVRELYFAPDRLRK